MHARAVGSNEKTSIQNRRMGKVGRHVELCRIQRGTKDRAHPTVLFSNSAAGTVRFRSRDYHRAVQKDDSYQFTAPKLSACNDWLKLYPIKPPVTRV